MKDDEYRQTGLELPQPQGRQAEMERLWNTYEPWPDDLQRKRNAELEKKYPGITYVFHTLLDMIPWEETEEVVEFPVAAAIVRPIMKEEVPGKPYQTLEIIAKGTNMVKHTGLPSNHAEKWVIEEALQKLGVEHLPDNCMVVSTAEPCNMCASVIANADASTLIYGITQDDVRGMEIYVRGELKRFRAEREGYDSDQTINQHRHHQDKKVTVEGGCCRNEVLSRMSLPAQMWYFRKYWNIYDDEGYSGARLHNWIRQNREAYQEPPTRKPGAGLDRNALLEE